MSRPKTLKLYIYETELFEIELFICMKMDLALNNLQRLICQKKKPNKEKKNKFIIINILKGEKKTKSSTNYLFLQNFFLF